MIQTLKSIQSWASSLVYVATARRCPLHRDESYEPFFIVGSPRSGNTLLRRIMHAAPGIYIAPEMSMLPRVIRSYRRYNYLPWPALVDMALGIMEFDEKFDRFQVTLSPLVAKLRDTPPQKQSLAYILDSFHRFHAEQSGHPCTRWGDKTPRNRLIMKRISMVFPRAKFICLMRDGVDVIHSIMDDLPEEHALEEASKMWAETVQYMREFQTRRPQSCHKVNYEKMVTDPEATVRGICDFLSIPFDPSMINKTDHVQKMDVKDKPWHTNLHKPVFTDSIGKGRRHFTDENKRVIQSIAGDSLRLEGYRAATEEQ